MMTHSLSKTARVILAILALALIVVLGLAGMLRPDPRGFGTHMQLGLGPCGFREITGKPCPSCGMTTAFSWTMRARFVEGWRANPAGLAIAVMCVMSLPWLFAASISGRTWPFRSAEGPLVGVVLAGVAMALVLWAIRVLRISF